MQFNLKSWLGSQASYIFGMKLLDFIKFHKSCLCNICGDVIKSEHSTPSSCEHTFHVECLENWVETHRIDSQSNCPIDACGRAFTAISIRKALGGPVVRNISLAVETQCPICCEDIQPPVATPESCNHHFCFSCLNEWAKIRHECPLDRGPFELILLSSRIDGPIIERRFAPPAYQPPPEEEDTTACEICHSQEDEENLLLCDSCDKGFHTYCLPNPLSSIPEGDWFCPACVDQPNLPPLSPSSVLSSPGTVTPRRRHNSVRAARRRVRRTRYADISAEEVNEPENENSADESYMGYLTSEAQTRLSSIAERRHRGTGLLRDLIEQLIDRAALEEAHRRHRRRRIRLAEGPESPPLLPRPQPQSQNTGGISPPLLLRPSLSDCGDLRSRINRKRCRIVDSDSDEGNSNSCPPVCHRRQRLRVALESPEHSDFSQPPSASSSRTLESHHQNSQKEPSSACLAQEPATSPAVCDPLAVVSVGVSDRLAKDLLGTMPSTSTGQTNTADEMNNSISTNNPDTSIIGSGVDDGNVNNMSHQDLFASFDDDPILMHIADEIRDIGSCVLPWKAKRRSRRRLPTKAPTRSRKKSRKAKPGRRKGKGLRLTSAQKRIRRSIRRLSGDKISLRRAQQNARNLSSSERGHYNSALSIGGAELDCGSPTQSSLASSGYDVPSGGPLGRLEASQSSLFRFSAQNMGMNANNSVSPKKLSFSTSPSTACLGKSQGEKTSTVITAGSNISSQRPVTNGHVGVSERLLSNNSTWSPAETSRVRKLLRDHLSTVVSTSVNSELAAKICQRALLKITAKPCHSVSEARMKRLVEDYVQFYRRNPLT